MNATSRVMKAQEVSDALAAGHYNFEDLRERCEDYLESIRQQSRTMLQQTQQECEQLKAEARQAGLQQGLQEGLQTAEQQFESRVQQAAKAMVDKRLKPIVPQLEQAAQTILSLRDQTEVQWQQQALELVLIIAEKLIHRKIEAHPEIVLDRLSQVLKMVIGNTSIQLQLAQIDLENLEEHLESLTSHMQHTRIEMKSLPELNSGECRIQMGHGEIDARIQTQLQRIAEELIG